MKIIKLFAFLLFIIVQNQCVFAKKGPFSHIIAQFRAITKHIYKGIYIGDASQIPLINYEYYWRRVTTKAKTPKENLKILGIAHKILTEEINLERKKIKKSILPVMPPSLTRIYGIPKLKMICHIFTNEAVFYKIEMLRLQKKFISRAMFAQNLVNASKKITQSNWFTHSFNGF